MVKVDVYRGPQDVHNMLEYLKSDHVEFVVSVLYFLSGHLFMPFNWIVLLISSSIFFSPRLLS